MENIFPFSKKPTNSSTHSSAINSPSHIIDTFDTEQDPNLITPLSPSSRTSLPSLSSPSPSFLDPSFTYPQTVPPPPRRSIEITNHCFYLQDYECANVTSPHSINYVLSYDGLSPEYKTFALNLNVMQEPKSYLEAMKIVEWQQAMESELHALEKNQTWEMMELQTG